jgi:membrane-associated phospholipid phosphatase
LGASRGEVRLQFLAESTLLAVGGGVAGVAAGLAVSVAATRVLLAMHWFSDVVAGLALGWAWFAACAVAFGGSVLRFGAGVEKVRRHARADAPAGSAN